MRRRVLGCGGLLLLALVGLACLGQLYPADFLFQLGAGWALFLVRVLPQVRVNPAAVGLALVCLVALALGLHAMLGWFYRQVASAGGPRAAWPARWTAAVLGLVPLMFVAGISAVGVTHQAAWLATAPEPVIRGGIRQAGARMQASNYLRWLALGMHTFQDRHRRLPPAAVSDKDGRPLLSWRVALLPYVEEEQLYAEFRLDEPWDSPHNLRLLPRIPRVYLPLGENSPVDRTATRYRVFTGPGTAFEGPQELRLRDDFPDGTSNTVLIVEAAEAVPWTKPDELVYDPHGPLPAVGAGFPDRFLAAMADGSVRDFRRPVNEPALRALITRNGGEPVPYE